MSDQYKEEERSSNVEKVDIDIADEDFEIDQISVSPSFKTGQLVAQGLAQFLTGFSRWGGKRLDVRDKIRLALEGDAVPQIHSLPPGPHGFHLEEIALGLSVNAKGEVGIPLVSKGEVGGEGSVTFTFKRKGTAEVG
jgi:hypothetical protein